MHDLVIEEQLLKLHALPHTLNGKNYLEFEDITFHKTNTKVVSNKKRFILEKYIMDNSEISNSFNSKYNDGVKPPAQVLEGEIVKETEKLYYINAHCNKGTWEGFLPKKSVKVEE